MPSFPITDVPVNISQVVTREALIQNTGNVTVYLDSDSTVSSGSFSLIVAPKTTVNWPANSTLWAATAAGDSGILSVLYGASGAGVGDITATITDPVNVQGGGQPLVALATGTLAAGASVSISIPAPANGLTYYGLRFYVGATSLSVPGDRQVMSYSIPFGIPITEAFTGNVTPTPTSGAVVTRTIARPNETEFSIPMLDEYPMSIDLSLATGTGSVIYQVSVWGISLAEYSALTDLTGQLAKQNLANSLSFTLPVGGGAINDVYLPPSFQPYELVRIGSGNMAAVQLFECASDGTGGLYLLSDPFQLPDDASLNTFAGPRNLAKRIGGSGRVPVVRFNASASNTGTVRLYIRK